MWKGNLGEFLVVDVKENENDDDEKKEKAGKTKKEDRGK